MKRSLILLTALFFLSSSAWSAGTLEVTAPKGGQKWTTGKSYQIKWNKGDAGATVKIQLLKSGKHYKWVSKKTKNDGNHLWKIPTTVKAASAGYSIKISSKTKKSINDTSNKTFTITGGVPPPSTFELTSSAFGNNGNIPEKSCFQYNLTTIPNSS